MRDYPVPRNVMVDTPAGTGGTEQREAARRLNAPPATPDGTEQSAPRKGSKRRRWTYRRRVVAFAHLEVGQGRTEGGHFDFPRRPAVESLLDALPPDVERVYLLGGYPPLDIQELRRWSIGPLTCWSVAEKGHYLETSKSPVLRYLDSRRGHTVEIYRASDWFGDLALSPTAALDAWGRVRDALQVIAPGAELLATPGQTGRDLWSRLIPHGVEYPVLDDDAQQLIRSTTGQGRIETCPAVDPLPGLAELDGRLMYGALCWQLGAGPAVHYDGDIYHGMTRARYRATFRVPSDWTHVGLLGVMDDRAGWRFPSAPGEGGMGWFDAAEIDLAIRHGWPVQILESLALIDSNARPLDHWAKQLTAAAERAELVKDRPLRAGLRAVLLHGIGAFVGRPQSTTKVVPRAKGGRVPTDARHVMVTADSIYWTEQLPDTRGERHPEWSAGIWGRARTRLLSAPGGTGALAVPRESVVAFRTDALYLTADPGWTDDGKVGRFRCKSWRPGPLPAPSNGVELLALRDGGR